jgi:long-chain acyl-CoA synthetase
MDKTTPYNIFATFAETAVQRKNNTAVVYLGTRFSYHRVKDMAEGFASGLSHAGLTAGQKIIIYIPNSIQWVVAWLGIQKMGGVSVPMISNISPTTARPEPLSAPTPILAM